MATAATGHQAGEPRPPDVMNDPEYATNTRDSRKGDDVDTCRICRGEGTSEEPLFYPCKCSGSIKFVHQECLMEWLSHSQKKYCELCKTPFRFTKLYDPTMPQKLPSGLFMKRASVHTFRFALTVCRWALVAGVWLLCLPWSMRFTWRTLFWLGDGGWARDLHTRRSSYGVLSSQMHPLGGNRTSASASSLVEAISSDLFSPSLGFSTETSAPDPAVTALPSSGHTAASFMEQLSGNLHSMLKSAWGAWANTSIAYRFDTGSGTRQAPMRHSTLLSNVALLNSTTSSPTINRLVLDVFEGQIITLVVVVVFILIFLIREWVVQQQPVMNLNAANQEENAQADAEGVEDDANAADVEEREENGSWLDTDSDSDRDRENGVDAQPNDAGAEGRGLAGLLSSQGRLGLGESAEDSVVGDFRKQALDAVETLPPSLRAPMSEGRFDDVRKLMRELPDEEADATKEKLTEMTEIYKAAKERLKAVADERSSTEVSEQTSRGKQEQETGDVGATSEEANVESSVLHRPNMPERGSSLIAADIQRDFEEVRAHHLRAANVAPTPSQSSVETPSRYDVSNSSPENAVESSRSDFSNHEPRADLANGHAAKNTDQTRAGEDTRRDGGSTSVHSSESWQHITMAAADEFGAISHHGEDVEQTSRTIGKRKIIDIPQTDGQGADNLDSSSSSANEHVDVPSALESSHSESSGSSTHPADTTSQTLHADTRIVQPLEARAEPTDPHEATQPLDRTGGTEHDGVDAVPYRAIDPVAGPQSLLETMIDWFWGDVNVPEPDVPGEDDERVVGNLADEPPFVPHRANRLHAGAAEEAEEEEEDGNEADDEHDPEVVEAAAQAGVNINDADAVDDVEDMEGIMELIGVQGPLVGLFQNALFCAILISAAIAGAVFLPYLWGKLVLLLVAHPADILIKIPLQMVAAVGDFCLDVFLFAGASCILWSTLAVRVFLSVLGKVVPSLAVNVSFGEVTSVTKKIAGEGLERIINALAAVGAVDSEYFHMSLDAHAALRSIEGEVTDTVTFIQNALSMAYHFVSTVTIDSLFTDVATRFPQLGVALGQFLLSRLKEVFDTVVLFVSKTSELKLAFNVTEPSTVVDPSLAYWSAGDRAMAIFAGYAFFTLAGNLYLRHGAPFSSSEQGKRVETIFTEFLQQAGGVLKVILIISIEMILFPLYCGVLLDVALMPLFQSASISSRMGTTKISPWWSIFVHWFIGTCYMFHFALFVSMCRKIMRSGVLYFIRDPDDPTFHPVRDVLERNVASQLRKIGFSAMVYGGLVIVCLGGVVWSLWCTFDCVLPIRWSSSMPGREFPLDLLFYNFVTPVVIKFFKPLDVLTAVYKWWFHKCARLLRLSDFMFNQQHSDEEGHHVRRTWSAWLRAKQGDVEKPVEDESEDTMRDLEGEDACFVPDGRYVRAPSTDTVRIPKGMPVFVEVDKFDNRMDGRPENEGVHRKNSPYTKRVYIPPWFRVRIGLFVLAIWLFAAATGVCVTILPLQFGRVLLGYVFPADLRLNDIYAFSMGAYVLGGLFCLAFKIGSFASIYHTAFTHADEPTTAAGRSARPAVPIRLFTALLYVLQRLATLLYLYSALLIVLPMLCALTIELYFLMPLHTYTAPRDTHTVFLLQDWALGVLYARIIAAGLIARHPDARLARAWNHVIRRGPFDPDVRAATRAFVLPALLAFTIAIGLPYAAASLVLRVAPVVRADPLARAMVYRTAYPTCSSLAIAVWATRRAAGGVKRWRGRIRDEVYLVGERLHNFGERKAKGPNSGVGIPSGSGVVGGAT